MTTRRFVFAYDVNTDAIQARRTLEDWITFLSDDLDDPKTTTWDDVYSVILWAFITGGDFTEFVHESDIDYPEEDL